MPTDLDQQLPRFAEALDRQAPAISVDEILSRASVVVDVDLVELTLSDQAPRGNGVSWTSAPQGDDGTVDRVVPMELAPTTAARSRARRHVALKVAFGVAASAMLVVAMAVTVRVGDEPDRVDVPTSMVPTAPSTTESTTTPSTTTPPAATSGGMWPQATVEEVRAAQELADAGDPAYTWQVDPQLVEDDSWVAERHQIELVDRFLREVLGWEAYLLSSSQGTPSGGRFYDERYLRCAPGRTNPLYPPGPEPDPGELCAPTIDDLRYESVSLDLAQLARQGNDGIWVVNGWEMTAPFAQTDPAPVEAVGIERLEEFLTARIAGTGAEGHVQAANNRDVPLLYATTTGAAYERYEIERLDRPRWPDGRMTFSVRLFADDDATVVEQQIAWDRRQSGGFWMDPGTTTENGQPIVLSYTSADGEVTVSAPNTWEGWFAGLDDGEGEDEQALDVWFGNLWRRDDLFGSGDRIGFVDPVAYDSWCAANGGSPLLTSPADAAAIAQQVIADPNFDTTTPAAARIGGLEAVSIDVALAPDGQACGIGMIEISRWIHELWEPGWRLRLYLIDLPEGMSVETLAITVVAPEARFDEVIEETKPIIDSIEFHPQSA
jgi:hypothetical protein